MKIFDFKKEKKRVYLDHASATPVKDLAIKTFVEVSQKFFANASSIHGEGEMAREFLEKLRKDFAYLIRAKKNEVYFVSSATEANNIFIQGTVKRFLKEGKVPHIITSRAEHSSISEPVLAMEKLGAEVTYLVPTPTGRILMEDFEKALRAETALICLSSIHSETGAKQDVREMSIILQKTFKESARKPLLYVDATQAVEYDTVDVGTLLCDGMTFGARKIGALGGVALLYAKHGRELEPITYGGGQEGGLKSGTENLALISAFYAVAKETISNKERQSLVKNKVAEIREQAIKILQEKLQDKVEIVGEIKTKSHNPQKTLNELNFKNSAPHIVMLYVPNILGEELVLRLDAKGVAVSTASACSILEGAGSHLLQSLGKEKEAKETIRISFNEQTSLEDIEYFVSMLSEIVEKYQNVLK
jgi:cysteine desulfurase